MQFFQVSLALLIQNSQCHVIHSLQATKLCKKNDTATKDDAISRLISNNATNTGRQVHENKSAKSSKKNENKSALSESPSSSSSFPDTNHYCLLNHGVNVVLLHQSSLVLLPHCSLFPCPTCPALSCCHVIHICLYEVVFFVERNQYSRRTNRRYILSLGTDDKF